MQHKSYKIWNKALSYLVFIIATVVYLLTMERSASPWDCSEFILTFHNLEVGHPPGAPFYMLFYNFFNSLFGIDSVATVANAISAVLSGGTILILFRTISHLIRRTTQHSALAPEVTAWLSLGGGLVGSLLYAFTDTFWFSAVEAEVYSFSSFFTALVFYLMLRWEEVAHQRDSDKWMIAIAYLMGLSIGVHLLNLLAIPAMALLYYFKRYDHPTVKGGIIATLLSFGLIGIIMFGIVQGIPKVAGWIEVFAVNTIGMPFNGGLAIHVSLLLASLALTYYFIHHRPEKAQTIRFLFLVDVVLMGIPFIGSSWFIPVILLAVVLYLLFKRRLNYRLLSLMTASMFVFFIGISTYGVILIRSNADVPMNQNTPSDVFSLRYYLSREQYGKTPLIYGPSYASVPEYESNGRIKLQESTIWKRSEKVSPTDKDHYKAHTQQEPIYRSDMQMLFPRMYNSTQAHFPDGYKAWSNQKGKLMTIQDRGETRTIEVPTFADNLRYFFVYQVNYMYWRYFLWNFSGRQNDLLGQGEVTKGNWITGISWIDGLFLGSQKDLPDFIKNNKAHNKYYMLPLILGILGLLFQFNGSRKGQETFWITFALFFMTGLAIVLYINQPPAQVRERDYAFAGSFYAFCIWIGFSVPALYNLFTKGGKRNSLTMVALSTLIGLGVTTQLLAQNYDDHNRNGRTLISDFGRNYLESCEENAIIFCNGDNDTFPLWYVQGVEKVRTDIKVCNTSYLQADWYIEQMKKQTYEAAPMPILWGMKEYGGDRRGIAYIFPLIKDSLDMTTALAYVASDDKRHKQIPNIAQEVDYIPANKLYIPYDAQKLIAQGSLLPSDTAFIGDSKMYFDFSQKKYLGKHELIILNTLNQSKFIRPVYYCITVGESERLGMTPNFRQTGMAYKVMPFVTKGRSEIDVERMYDNVVNKFRWGGADKPGLYMDENARRSCETYRSMIFAPLAKALVEKGDTIRAKEVLALAAKAIHAETVPHGLSSIPLIAAHYLAGNNKDAYALSQELIERSLNNLKWYHSFTGDKYIAVLRDVEQDLLIAYELLRIDEAQDGTLNKNYRETFNVYEQHYFQVKQALDRRY